MDTIKNPGQGQYYNCFGCLSWSAVFAGAFAAVALSILINLFNIGLGSSAYAMGGSAAAITTLTLIWTILTVFITMFLSGLVSGYLAQKHNHSSCSGLTHGFLAWCVGLVMMLILTAHLSLILPVNLQAVTSSTNTAVTATQTSANTTTMRTTQSNRERPEVQNVRVNDERAAAVVAMISLQAFFILLVGAIASCLGGHFGIRCDDHHRRDDVVNVKK